MTESKQIMVTRKCSLCSREELNLKGEPATWRPETLPRDTRCQHCGLHGLVPEEAVTQRVFKPEPAVDWLADRPRIGRPPQKLVERRKAEKLAAEQALLAS